jgi:predicted RNA-binding Zn-ribbon protein involved in translation (DUF1610 family)
MKYQEDSAYVQCTDCGNIFLIEKRINVETLYIEEYCPYCGHVHMVLNVGNGDILDKYLFYSSVLDDRFFIYN